MRHGCSCGVTSTMPTTGLAPLSQLKCLCWHEAGAGAEAIQAFSNRRVWAAARARPRTRTSPRCALFLQCVIRCCVWLCPRVRGRAHASSVAHAYARHRVVGWTRLGYTRLQFDATRALIRTPTHFDSLSPPLPSPSSCGTPTSSPTGHPVHLGTVLSRCPHYLPSMGSRWGIPKPPGEGGGCVLL